LECFSLTCVRKACLSQGTRSIGQGLFDADDLTALRTLAETMTGAIHFVPLVQAIRGRSILAFSCPQFPTRRGRMLSLCIPELHQLLSLGMRPRAKAASSGASSGGRSRLDPTQSQQRVSRAFAVLLGIALLGSLPPYPEGFVS